MTAARIPAEDSAGETTSPGPAAAPVVRPETMTGRAGPARAALGDGPVRACIASLPQPQRGVAEAVDALAARTLPGLQRSVKWGMAYYGVGDGWCFSCGAVADHVTVMFVNAVTTLDPVPPVTPVAMGKATRGVELRRVGDLDEAQLAAWMQQSAAVPGVGAQKRRARAVAGGVGRRGHPHP